MENDEFYFPGYRIDSDQKILKGWEKIFRSRKHKTYPKKSVVVEQGQKVKYAYFIVSGLVEYTYTCNDGSQKLIDIMADGSIFGLQPIFGVNPAAGSLIAMEDCILSLISLKELNYYMDQDINLAKELLADFAKITGGLMRQIYSQTFNTDYRVKKVIYLFADYKRKTIPRQQNIFISLSQEDLARICRTTRVTVTKVLGELKKQKLINTTYGGIVVNNLDSLKNEIYLQS